MPLLSHAFFLRFNENSMNATPHAASTMTRGMVMLFAFCCGAIVANIYYAQPIIELIAPDIGLTPAMASLIVSLTQIGYALGLFFLVPLGDLLENRKLMIATTVVAIASLLGAAFTEQPNLFLLVSLLIGFSSVSVQILIRWPRTWHLPNPVAGWSAASWAGCCSVSCWHGRCPASWPTISAGVRCSWPPPR